MTSPQNHSLSEFQTLMKMPDHPFAAGTAWWVRHTGAGRYPGWAGNSHPWIPAFAGMTSCDCVLLFVTGEIKFSSAVLYPLVHEILCRNAKKPQICHSERSEESCIFQLHTKDKISRLRLEMTMQHSISCTRGATPRMKMISLTTGSVLRCHSEAKPKNLVTVESSDEMPRCVRLL